MFFKQCNCLIPALHLPYVIRGADAPLILRAVSDRGVRSEPSRNKKKNKKKNSRPNYVATNVLPIMRIYCLVLSQELIKSTQLKSRNE